MKFLSKFLYTRASYAIQVFATGQINKKEHT